MLVAARWPGWPRAGRGTPPPRARRAHQLAREIPGRDGHAGDGDLSTAAARCARRADEFARQSRCCIRARQTADDLLERAAFRSGNWADVLVVTNDSAVRDVVGAGGPDLKLREFFALHPERDGTTDAGHQKPQPARANSSTDRQPMKTTAPLAPPAALAGSPPRRARRTATLPAGV